MRQKHTVKSQQDRMYPRRCCLFSVQRYRWQMRHPLTPESRARQDGRKENTLPPPKKRCIQWALEIKYEAIHSKVWFPWKVTVSELVFKMLPVHELQILLLLLGPKKAMDQGSAAYKSWQDQAGPPLSPNLSLGKLSFLPPRWISTNICRQRTRGWQSLWGQWLGKILIQLKWLRLSGSIPAGAIYFLG